MVFKGVVEAAVSSVSWRCSDLINWKKSPLMGSHIQTLLDDNID